MSPWTTALERDGVARLGKVLDDGELEALRAAWCELVDTQAERSGLGRDRWLAQIVQVSAPHAAHPTFAALARHERLWAAARLALATDAPQLLLMHLVWRAPRQDMALPWHQDLVTWPETEGPAEPVAVWVALDDAAADSGALRYAPGSHLLTASQPDEPDPVVYPVEAGEALVHSARTWHASGANRSDSWRRAAILVFTPARQDPH